LFPVAPAPRPPDWQWKTETLEGFLSNVRIEYAGRLVHSDPNFQHFRMEEETRVVSQGYAADPYDRARMEGSPFGAA